MEALALPWRGPHGTGNKPAVCTTLGPYSNPIPTAPAEQGSQHSSIPFTEDVQKFKGTQWQSWDLPLVGSDSKAQPLPCPLHHPSS